MPGVKRVPKGTPIPPRTVYVLTDEDMAHELRLRQEELGITSADLAALSGVALDDVWWALHPRRRARRPPVALVQRLAIAMGGTMAFAWQGAAKVGRLGLEPPALPTMVMLPVEREEPPASPPPIIPGAAPSPGAPLPLLPLAGDGVGDEAG